MALITCPECGREISDKAAACPGCGYPVGKDNDSRRDQLQDQAYSNMNNSFQIDNGNKSNLQQRFYQKTWFTILLCVFFPPAGVALLFIYKRPKTLVPRIIITIFLIAYTIMLAIPIEEDTTRNHNTKAKPSAITASPIETLKPSLSEPETTAAPTIAQKDTKPETTETPDNNYAELSENEYKSQCQELWHDDIFFSEDNLKGKLVKLDLFVEEEHFYDAETVMYNSMVSDFLQEYDLERTFYFCGVNRNDKTASYIGGQVRLYIPNDYATELTIGDHLIFYGEIIDYSTMSWDGYNSCYLLPKFIEKND